MTRQVLHAAFSEALAYTISSNETLGLEILRLLDILTVLIFLGPTSLPQVRVYVCIGIMRNVCMYITMFMYLIFVLLWL